MTPAFNKAARCEFYNFLIKRHCSCFLGIFLKFSEWIFKNATFPKMLLSSSHVSVKLSTADLLKRKTSFEALTVKVVSCNNKFNTGT